MSFRRAVLPLLIALFAIPPAWADYDDDGQELYEAEICNAGKIAFDVAMAYRDWGFSDPYWMISYWSHIAPGECETVFSHHYSLGLGDTLPVHMAFAFTDSRGVWGAASVSTPKDKDDFADSHVQFCVGRESFEYRVNDPKNPRADCPQRTAGHSLDLLIPASFVWQPTRGRRWNPLTHLLSPPAHVAIQLVSSDRAIALGPRGPASAVPEVASNMEDFVQVMRNTLNAIPSQEEIKNPDGSTWLQPGYRWVGICAEREVVYKGSLSGLQTPRAQAIRSALHETLAARPNGTVRLEVIEPNGRVMADLLAGQFGDCAGSGQIEYRLQSPEGPGAPDGSPAVQLLSVIKDAVRGPGAPVPIRATPVRNVGVCVTDANSKMPAWGGRESAKARAFKDAIRQYLSTHRFEDRVGSALFRVTETGGGFTFSNVEGYCPPAELFHVTVAKD